MLKVTKKETFNDLVAKAESNPDWFQQEYPQPKTRTGLPADSGEATKAEWNQAYKTYVSRAKAANQQPVPRFKFARMIQKTEKGLIPYLQERDF